MFLFFLPVFGLTLYQATIWNSVNSPAVAPMTAKCRRRDRWSREKVRGCAEDRSGAEEGRECVGDSRSSAAY